MSMHEPTGLGGGQAVVFLEDRGFIAFIRLTGICFKDL